MQVEQAEIDVKSGIIEKIEACVSHDLTHNDGIMLSLSVVQVKWLIRQTQRMRDITLHSLDHLEVNAELEEKNVKLASRAINLEHLLIEEKIKRDQLRQILNEMTEHADYPFMVQEYIEAIHNLYSFPAKRR